MGDRTGVTPALRWTWGVGVALLVTGLVALTSIAGGPLVAELGLALVSVAAGTTAARGSSVSGSWNLLAWFVPALPVLASLAVYAWLAHRAADPMAVVLLVVIGGGVAVGTWAVFAVALVVETVRQRRRRFVGPRPAWNNDPIPPPHS